MKKNTLAQFKILCFEIYRREKKMPLDETILLFDDYRIFTFLSSCYDKWNDLEISEIVTRIDEYIDSKR